MSTLQNSTLDKSRRKLYVWRTIASFLIILFAMPLGHALMLLMEHYLAPSTVHVAGFLLGLAGLIIVIVGVFVRGDTRQTLLGLLGGLLFWTGWVEFLFLYYAHRYGVHPELVNGVVSTTSTYVDGISTTVMHINGKLVNSMSEPWVKDAMATRPEYLILSASFGFWMMMMVMYIFSTRNGCLFITWIQKVCFRSKRKAIAPHPMTRHTSIVTFMEVNMMLWASYLLLMFCYDKNFLGDHHPVTFMVGAFCLVGSILMFWKQLRLSAWGANLRMAYATVIVFWVPVEILGRIDFFKEFWVEPQEYAVPLLIILAAFIGLGIYIVMKSRSGASRG